MLVVFLEFTLGPLAMRGSKVIKTNVPKVYKCYIRIRQILNIMKKIIRMALICAVLTAAVAIQSCNTPKEVEILTEVTSTELLRTTQSWNEEELPDYPQGKPELVAVKYTVPPGARLGWHHHVSMNHGVLVHGELTIIGVDGKTKVVKEGEVVVEMVDAVHRGENRGDKTVVLYMFYLSQEGLPLSVQNPEVQQ